MGLRPGVGHAMASEQLQRERKLQARIRARLAGHYEDRWESGVDPLVIPSTVSALLGRCTAAEKEAEVYLERLRDLAHGELNAGAIALAFDAALGILRETFYLTNAMSLNFPDAQMREISRAQSVAFTLKINALFMDNRAYRAIRALAEDGRSGSKSQRWLDKTWRAMHHAGAALTGECRAELLDCQERLASLGAAYNRTIQETADLVGRLDPARLRGLPADEVERRVVAPGQAQLLIPRDLELVLTYVHSEAVREWAWRTAQACGAENVDTFFHILECRQRIAELIGGEGATWADHALKETSLGSAKGAAQFLTQLEDRVNAQAPWEEAKLLVEKRRGRPGDVSRPDEVMPWDRAYLHRQIEELGITPAIREEMRHLLTLDGVLRGMFMVLREVFEVDFVLQQDGRAWHPTVQTYEVRDRTTGRPLGRAHLDLGRRLGKGASACTVNMAGGRAHYTLPEAALLSSFSPSHEGGPVFLEPRQVVELFHEMGHVLHALFSGHTDRSGLSSLNMGRDATELVGMMCENLTSHPEFLQALFDFSGRSPSPQVMDRLEKAFRSVRGLEFFRRDMFWSAFYLEAHRRPADQVRPKQLWAEVAARQGWRGHLPVSQPHRVSPHLVDYGPAYLIYLDATLKGDAVYSFGEGHRPLRRFADRYMAGAVAPGEVLLRSYLGREVNLKKLYARRYEMARKPNSKRSELPRTRTEIADLGRMANRTAMERLEALKRRLAADGLGLEAEEIVAACHQILEPMDEALISMTQIEMLSAEPTLQAFARRWGEALGSLLDEVLQEPGVFDALQILERANNLDDRLLFWIRSRLRPVS